MRFGFGFRGTARRSTLFAFLSGVAAFGPALAVDGVVEIDQARALAGGVTPGDAPGFPVTLDRQGSYRLTGNLDVSGQPSPQNVTAIDITSSFVTLDLNGFTIVGPTVCSGSPVTSCSPTGTGDGINSRLANFVRIGNGIVRGFGDAGIDAGMATIERVQAFGNAARGIAVHWGGLVTESVAGMNGTYGISGSGLLAQSSRAVDNGLLGFYAYPGEVRDCEAVHNGMYGIAVYDGLVVGSTSRGNLNYAIVASNSGYTLNNASGVATITGGTSLGKNLCNGTLCP